MDLLLIVLAFSVPMAVAVLLLLRHLRDSCTAAWARVARRHGLELHAPEYGPPSLFGEIEGRSCLVRFEANGEDEPPIAHLTLAAACPPDFSLTLRPEGVTTWLEQRLGATELEVGDAVFDARFCVRTTASEQARRLLDRPTRRALLEADFDALVLQDDALEVEFHAGSWTRIAGLAPRVDRTLSAAVGLARRAQGGALRARPVRSEGGTSFPTPARAAATVVSLVTVLLFLAGAGGVDAILRGRAHDQREALETRRANTDLALEIAGLANERDLRAMAKRHGMDPRVAELMRGTERGRALLERQRDAEAERAAEVAAEPARVAALRTRYRTLRAKQPDPAAFDDELAARVREFALPPAASSGRTLREVAAGADRVVSTR